MFVILFEFGIYNAMLNQTQKLLIFAIIIISNLIYYHLPNLNYLLKNYTFMVLKYAFLDFIKNSETILNPKPAFIKFVKAYI